MRPLVGLRTCRIHSLTLSLDSNLNKMKMKKKTLGVIICLYVTSTLDDVFFLFGRSWWIIGIKIPRRTDRLFLSSTPSSTQVREICDDRANKRLTFLLSSDRSSRVETSEGNVLRINDHLLLLLLLLLQQIEFLFFCYLLDLTWTGIINVCVIYECLHDIWSPFLHHNSHSSPSLSHLFLTHLGG